MKKIIIILVAILIGVEGLNWWVYKKSKQDTEAPQKISQQEISSLQVNSLDEKNASEQKTTSDNEKVAVDSAAQETTDERTGLEKKDISSEQALADASGILAGFPAPSVERVNGINERTIHMGVRQWEWVPVRLEAKSGEKVRLVIHNADVLHSISIQEFNVNAYIPEDGAVVEFMADRKGTFKFFCNTPCGKDHDKMTGEIIIS